MATATLTVQRNALAPTTGVQTCTAGDTLTVRFQAPGGLRAPRVEIWGYPPGFATPAGWTLDATNRAIYYAGADALPPAVTAPAGPAKLFFRGLAANADPDDASAIKVLSANGLNATPAGETTQFGGPTQGAAKDVDANFRVIDSFMTSGGGGGGGGGGPVALGGDLAGTSDAASVVKARNVPFGEELEDALDEATDGRILHTANDSGGLGGGKIALSTSPANGDVPRWDSGERRYQLAPPNAVALLDILIDDLGTPAAAKGRMLMQCDPDSAGVVRWVVLPAPPAGSRTRLAFNGGAANPLPEWNAIGFAEVLAALGAATSTVSLGSQQMTGGDPTSAQAFATKNYTDAAILAAINKQDWKASCRMVATSNVTLSGLQTIDGVSGAAGDRILLTGQTTASENGPWVMASGAWARATDADTSAEVTSGMLVAVTEGTTYGDTVWQLTSNDPIVLGTTPLVFTMVNPGASISAISLTGGASTRTLTAAECAAGTIELGGTLSANVEVTLADLRGRSWRVRNTSSGTYLEKLSGPSGGSCYLLPGQSRLVWLDSAGVLRGEDLRSLVYEATVSLTGLAAAGEVTHCALPALCTIDLAEALETTAAAPTSLQYNLGTNDSPPDALYRNLIVDGALGTVNTLHGQDKTKLGSAMATNGYAFLAAASTLKSKLGGVGTATAGGLRVLVRGRWLG